MKDTVNRHSPRPQSDHAVATERSSSPPSSLSPQRRSPRHVDFDDPAPGHHHSANATGNAKRKELPIFLQRQIQFREAGADLLTTDQQQDLKDKYKLYHPNNSNRADDVKTRKASLDLRMQWPTIVPPGPGLMNEGNTCFLNATLQCLCYCPPFSLYVRSGLHTSRCPLKAQACLLCDLSGLLDKLLPSFASPGKSAAMVIPRVRTSVSAHGMVARLREVARHFRPGRQEDAHEYLRFLMAALSCRFLAVDQVDVVGQVFGGALASAISCAQCGQVSTTVDPVLDVSLDLPPSAKSVEDCWRHFIRPERLKYAYKCSHCCLHSQHHHHSYGKNSKDSSIGNGPGTSRKGVEGCTKQLRLQTAPPVLTVHLKRFSCQGLSNVQKISRHLDYGEHLSIGVGDSDQVIEYALIGVLVHQGSSCHNGHYYAFVKAANQLWYEMNDSSVRQVGLPTVLQQPAYVLFYLQRPSPIAPVSSLQRGVRGKLSKSLQAGNETPKQPTGIEVKRTKHFLEHEQAGKPLDSVDPEQIDELVEHRPKRLSLSPPTKTKAVKKGVWIVERIRQDDHRKNNRH